MTAPVSLGLIGFFNWVGVGRRGFGDNMQILNSRDSNHPPWCQMKALVLYFPRMSLDIRFELKLSEICEETSLINM